MLPDRPGSPCAKMDVPACCKTDERAMLADSLAKLRPRYGYGFGDAFSVMDDKLLMVFRGDSASHPIDHAVVKSAQETYR